MEIARRAVSLPSRALPCLGKRPAYLNPTLAFFIRGKTNASASANKDTNINLGFYRLIRQTEHVEEASILKITTC